MISRHDDTSPAVHWTVARLLEWTENYFRSLGLPTPRLDAEILLASALECTRLDLYTGYQRLVEPRERARFRALVERRARREPVAYLMGRREFYSLSFEVSPSVLIPRPETEHLVELALDALKGRSPADGAPRVLDLGTGSGNLAVAIAVNAPQVLVDAVDSSAPALEVAGRNAQAHGVADRVSFFLGDLFEPLRVRGGSYAAIVSNPPYVARAEIEGLMPDVRDHEPREAYLDTKSPDGDGLGFYRAIAGEAAAYIEPTGILGVEVGFGQAPRVVEIFNARGWNLRRVIKDYGGIERVVAAAPGASAPETPR